MKIDEAKEALDQGKTLVFEYPAQWNYVGANYRAYRTDREGYVCDVCYASEPGHRRPPQWGSQRFTEFVQSLPRPVSSSEAWYIEQGDKPQ